MKDFFELDRDLIPQWGSVFQESKVSKKTGVQAKTPIRRNCPIRPLASRSSQEMDLLP